MAVFASLAIAVGGATYTAALALRRQTQADRYARTLAQELEEKRRAALTERQESAKRILDLETRRLHFGHGPKCSSQGICAPPLRARMVATLLCIYGVVRPRS